MWICFFLYFTVELLSNLLCMRSLTLGSRHTAELPINLFQMRPMTLKITSALKFFMHEVIDLRSRITVQMFKFFYWRGHWPLKKFHCWITHKSIRISSLTFKMVHFYSNSTVCFSQDFFGLKIRSYVYLCWSEGNSALTYSSSTAKTRHVSTKFWRKFEARRRYGFGFEFVEWKLTNVIRVTTFWRNSFSILFLLYCFSIAVSQIQIFPVNFQGFKPKKTIACYTTFDLS